MFDEARVDPCGFATVGTSAVHERLGEGVVLDATVFAVRRKISRSMVRWTAKLSSRATSAIGLRLTANGSVQLCQHLLYALVLAVQSLLLNPRQVAQSLGKMKLISYFFT